MKTIRGMSVVQEKPSDKNYVKSASKRTMDQKIIVKNAKKTKPVKTIEKMFTETDVDVVFKRIGKNLHEMKDVLDKKRSLQKTGRVPSLTIKELDGKIKIKEVAARKIMEDYIVACRKKTSKQNV